MFKIQSIKIDNFWHRFNASCDFNSDVNIIIGRNGTGKTTFMNILHAILAVDIDSILNHDFDSAEIKLIDGNKIKTIKARKLEDAKNPFLYIEYQISSSKFKVRVITPDDRRIANHYRKKAIEDSEELRQELAKLVSLSSLSVYRLRNSKDYEIRDNNGLRVISPVDYRLSELLQELTHYQLDLTQKARDVAIKLQKDVLASILYTKEDTEQQGYVLNFNKENEKQHLINAYTRLNAIDKDIRSRISYHVNAIDETVAKIKSDNTTNIDLKSLEALRKTQKIIKLSLKAEEETSGVFSQPDLFLNILKDFISDKKIEFDNGTLQISNLSGIINHQDLSSGEKQLLILFIETLLQRREQYIFLTDEPELSLHIAWQRKIIPAIRQLNPNAQIIAATHSPEIAAKYRNSIYDMEDLVRV